MPRCAATCLARRRIRSCRTTTLRRSSLTGLLLAVAALVFYLVRLDCGEAYARGCAMVTVVVGSLLLIWSVLANGRAWWRAALPRDARCWSVVAVVGLSLPLLMHFAPAAGILAIAPIAGEDWMIACAAALLAVAWQAGGYRSAK
jgi:magnesium-transporting ATPase (P-type)